MSARPPMQLHRAQPIDFVMSDEEEQEVRNGYDMAMKAPLPEPMQSAEQRRLAEYHRGMRNAIPQPESDVETVEQYESDAMAIAWVGWLLVACALVAIFGAIGYLAGRFLA